MSIHFIITGGTIDDLEYDSEENKPQAHASLIPGLLKQARITIEYTTEELMAKDSKFVTDADRERMAQSCEAAKADHIILTHGTMTMPDTAKYLGKKNIEKTIVLLGAAIPANQENSDALFNLGAAVSAVQILMKGVYITMNGRVFHWKDVRKNFEDGIFETEA